MAKNTRTRAATVNDLARSLDATLNETRKTTAAGADTRARAAHSREMDTESVPGKLWRALVRPGEGTLRRMYAHVFTPWYWGAPAFAAMSLHVGMAAEAGIAPAASALIAATGAGLTAAVAPAVLRSRWGQRRFPMASHWVRTQVGHSRTIAGVAVTGAVLMAAADPATADGWTLACSSAVLTLLSVSARWWQYHRHHTGVILPSWQDTPVQDPAGQGSGSTTPSDLHGRLVRRWDPHVAAEGKILPGARLLKVIPTTFGVMARVETGSDGQDMTTARAHLGRLGAALKINQSQLEIEEDDPEDGAEPDPTVFWLRVISRKIMDVPVPLDDGRPRVVVRDGKTMIRMGRYVDGDGEPEWLLYDGKSAWSGYVGGVTGSGKSSLTEGLALGMMQTGCTYIIYVDPKGGQSSPRIKDHANWFIPSGESQDWHAIADGLINLIKERGKYLQAQGTSGFQASAEFPGVNLIFDEYYEVKADSALVDKFGWIARKGRSSGVVLTVVTQGYGLDDLGKDSVRANVTAANAVALKMQQNQASNFTRDVPKSNPASLPDTENRPRNKGLAVSLRGRDCVMRTAYEGDDVTERLMQEASQVQVQDLDPFSADALNEGTKGMYERRHDDAEEAEAANEAEIAERIARGQRIQNGGKAGYAPQGADDAPGGADTATVDMPRELSQIPSLVLADIGAEGIPGAAGSDPRETLLSGWSGPARSILETLHDGGAMRRGDLEERVCRAQGCARATFSRALNSLSEHGRIQQLPNRGGWQLTPQNDHSE